MRGYDFDVDIALAYRVSGDHGLALPGLVPAGDEPKPDPVPHGRRIRYRRKTALDAAGHLV